MNSDKKFTTGVIVASSLIVVGIVVVVLRNRAKARKAEEGRIQAEKDKNKGTNQQSTTTSGTTTTPPTQTTKPSLGTSLANIFSANAQAKKAKEKVTSQDVINANLFMNQLMLGVPR